MQSTVVQSTLENIPNFKRNQHLCPPINNFNIRYLISLRKQERVYFRLCRIVPHVGAHSVGIAVAVRVALRRFFVKVGQQVPSVHTYIVTKSCAEHNNTKALPNNR